MRTKNATGQISMAKIYLFFYILYNLMLSFDMTLDSSYADTLLNHAKKLHEFAYNYQGYYTNAIPAYNFYR